MKKNLRNNLQKDIEEKVKSTLDFKYIVYSENKANILSD